MRQRGSGEAAIKTEIHEIVELVAFAPPKQALGIVDDAGTIAEFDETKKVVDIGAREKNGVGEIHHRGRGGVVVDDHIAAEQSGVADVEETGAACSGEA